MFKSPKKRSSIWIDCSSDASGGLGKIHSHHLSSDKSKETDSEKDLKQRRNKRDEMERSQKSEYKINVLFLFSAKTKWAFECTVLTFKTIFKGKNRDTPFDGLLSQCRKYILKTVNH